MNLNRFVSRYSTTIGLLLVQLVHGILPACEINAIRNMQIGPAMLRVASGSPLDVLQGRLILLERGLAMLRLLSEASMNIYIANLESDGEEYSSDSSGTESHSLPDSESLEHSLLSFQDTKIPKIPVTPSLHETLTYLFPETSPFGVVPKPKVMRSDTQPSLNSLASASSLYEYLEHYAPDKLPRQPLNCAKDKVDILARLITAPESLTEAYQLSPSLIQALSTPTAYPLNTKHGAYLTTREALISTFLVLYLNDRDQFKELAERVYQQVDTASSERLFSGDNTVSPSLSSAHRVISNWRSLVPAFTSALPTYLTHDKLLRHFPLNETDRPSACLYYNLLLLMNSLLYDTETDTYNTSALTCKPIADYYAIFGDPYTISPQAWCAWRNTVHRLYPVSVSLQDMADVQAYTSHFARMLSAITSPTSLASQKPEISELSSQVNNLSLDVCEELSSLPTGQPAAQKPLTLAESGKLIRAAITALCPSAVVNFSQPPELIFNCSSIESALPILIVHISSFSKHNSKCTSNSVEISFTCGHIIFQIHEMANNLRCPAKTFLPRVRIDSQESCVAWLLTHTLKVLIKSRRAYREASTLKPFTGVNNFEKDRVYSLFFSGMPECLPLLNKTALPQAFIQVVAERFITSSAYIGELMLSYLVGQVESLEHILEHTTPEAVFVWVMALDRVPEARKREICTLFARKAAGWTDARGVAYKQVVNLAATNELGAGSGCQAMKAREREPSMQRSGFVKLVANYKALAMENCLAHFLYFNRMDNALSMLQRLNLREQVDVSYETSAILKIRDLSSLSDNCIFYIQARKSEFSRKQQLNLLYYGITKMHLPDYKILECVKRELLKAVPFLILLRQHTEPAECFNSTVEEIDALLVLLERLRSFYSGIEDFEDFIRSSGIRNGSIAKLSKLEGSFNILVLVCEFIHEKILELEDTPSELTTAALNRLSSVFPRSHGVVQARLLVKDEDETDKLRIRHAGRKNASMWLIEYAKAYETENQMDAPLRE